MVSINAIIVRSYHIGLMSYNSIPMPAKANVPKEIKTFS
jgi:hypothetical protein